MRLWVCTLEGFCSFLCCIWYGYGILARASVSYDHQPSRYVTRQDRTHIPTLLQQLFS
jgi:hypothetical protein